MQPDDLTILDMLSFIYEDMDTDAIEEKFVDVTSKVFSFDKVGLFKTDWGSHGDFEWEMRASLTHNTLHLPVWLASWRNHPSQATAQRLTHLPSYIQMLIEMTKSAMSVLKNSNPHLYGQIQLEKLLFPYRRRKFRCLRSFNNSIPKKVFMTAAYALLHPRFTIQFIIERAKKPQPRDLLHDEYQYILKQVKALGVTKRVKILEENQVEHTRSEQ